MVFKGYTSIGDAWNEGFNTFAYDSVSDAGTDLGTDGTGNLNHLSHVFFASNNYAQSAVRRWLNSAAAAGSVWTPATKFSRPPSWVSTANGFLHGLPADFLEAVQPAVIPCSTISKYEVNSLDGTVYAINQVYNVTDKFFILSRPEMHGSWANTNYKDGTQLAYYEGLTNAERKKYDVSGVACYTWTRSANGLYQHRVDLPGSLGTGSTSNVHAVAPACIIA